MTDRHLIEEIRHLSLAMFRKNFFGVYHGSISARIDTESFLINTRDAVFDEITEASLIRLEHGVEDYRRHTASIDAGIHEAIYQRIPHAKYIAYSMPPYVMAYALAHDVFAPEDYFGDKLLGQIHIFDPETFHDWYRRAPSEIAGYFASHHGHIMLIKGYGVYAYDRDLTEMAKKIAVLENSARLIMLSS